MSTAAFTKMEALPPNQTQTFNKVKALIKKTLVDTNVFEETLSDQRNQRPSLSRQPSTKQLLSEMAQLHNKQPKWAVTSHKKNTNQREVILNANSKARAALNNLKLGDLEFKSINNVTYFGFTKDVKQASSQNLFTIDENKTIEGETYSELHKIIGNKLTTKLIDGKTYYSLASYTQKPESAPIKTSRPTLRPILEDYTVDNHNPLFRNELHNQLFSLLGEGTSRDINKHLSELVKKLTSDELKAVNSTVKKRFNEMTLFKSGARDAVLKGPLITIVKKYLLQQEAEIAAMKMQVNDENTIMNIEQEAKDNVHSRQYDKKIINPNILFIRQTLDNHLKNTKLPAPTINSLEDNYNLIFESQVPLD
jgi:hypothetical protein